MDCWLIHSLKLDFQVIGIISLVLHVLNSCDTLFELDILMRELRLVLLVEFFWQRLLGFFCNSVIPYRIYFSIIHKYYIWWAVILARLFTVFRLKSCIKWLIFGTLLRCFFWSLLGKFITFGELVSLVDAVSVHWHGWGHGHLMHLCNFINFSLYPLIKLLSNLYWFFIRLFCFCNFELNLIIILLIWNEVRWSIEDYWHRVLNLFWWLNPTSKFFQLVFD